MVEHLLTWVLCPIVATVLGGIALYEYRRRRTMPKLRVRLPEAGLRVLVSNGIGRDTAFVGEVGFLLPRGATEKAVVIWSDREPLRIDAGNSHEFRASYDALLDELVLNVGADGVHEQAALVRALRRSRELASDDPVIGLALFPVSLAQQVLLPGLGPRRVAYAETGDGSCFYSVSSRLIRWRLLGRLR